MTEFAGILTAVGGLVVGVAAAVGMVFMRKSKLVNERLEFIVKANHEAFSSMAQKAALEKQMRQDLEMMNQRLQERNRQLQAEIESLKSGSGQ